MDETTTRPGAPAADINGDGELDLGEVLAWSKEAFALPGDWLIWATLTYASPVAEVLGVDASDYGSVLSGVVSALVWLIVAVLAISTWGAVRNFDRALTERLVRIHREARRGLRIGIALLGYRLKRLRRAKPQRELVEFPKELEISDRELRALRLHGDVKPGYALALSEVATALRIGKNEARELLSRLARLHLLGTTVGGCDGESAFTLTAVGRAFLSHSREKSG